jgi:predicted permease
MNYDALLFVLLMLLLGKGCAVLRLFPDDAAEVLNRVVLWLCLPAAILRHASKLVADVDLVVLALVPWLLLAASVALIVPLARALGLRDDARAVLLLCVPLGNTSFLGYPLTQALLGDEALAHAVIYDQFGSFLMLSTWGLWVLARYGGDEPPSARAIGLRLVRFPPFVALLLALTLMPAAPPVWLDASLERLADALLPLVALAVGLTLRLALPRDTLAPFASGLVLKLMVLPALAFGLVTLLPLAPLPADVALMESAMPPMVTAAALAISHRLAPTLAAALVGYGTLLALLALPLWHSWAT